MTGYYEKELSVELYQTSPVPLDVQLECGSGELLALVGPSGSGKSTILRCIAGVATAENGSIYCGKSAWWDADNRVNLKPYQRNVGVVFQNYALFQHMDVYQNIATAMQGCTQTAIDRTVTELMRLINLSGLENRMPFELSGGQQQRVALARALAKNPDVLLLDEPFSALDLITRKKLRRDLSKIRQSLKIPIILVTHDHEEACQLADNLCLLHKGRTLDTDNPPTMIGKPKSPLIAKLLGQTNTLRGRVISYSTEHNTTTIAWHDRIIEVPYYEDFDLDDEIYWLVCESSISICPPVSTGKNNTPNTIPGTIRELIPMGDTTFLELSLTENMGETLSFAVPTHTVDCLPLTTEQEIFVHLKADGIHLMPLKYDTAVNIPDLAERSDSCDFPQQALASEIH